ncbi:histidine kinase [Spirosoma knui]
MKRFIERLLHQANFPIDSRQFWRYAFIFWGIFAIISYIQHMLIWLVNGRPTMYISDSLQWLITYLMWLAFTPFMLYTAQRFPIRFLGNKAGWGKAVVIHLLIASAFELLIALVSYGLLYEFYTFEIGKSLNAINILFWFFYSYTLTVVTYLLVVIGYSIISYTHQYQALKEQNLTYELNNEQLKTQLANAQLQSLKMQLNPHFLFNTHHAIVSLMLQNDTRKAIDMVTALSDLLRGVLAQQASNFLSLREELTLTQQYLAIQQIRFQDRLRIEYDIDPATERCPVPQLLLQPLVENAITHGISNMTTGALIRITSRKRVGELQITVFDNGVGQRKKGSSGSGLGLNNTQLRLHQAYGDAAHFAFDQPPGGSTLVTLTFPCQPGLLTSSTDVNLSLAHH